MKIVKSFLQICIVIALAHSDNTTQSHNLTNASLKHSSKAYEGTEEKLNDKPKTSEQNNNGSTSNSADISSKPRLLPAHIEVPWKSNQQLNNIQNNSTQDYVFPEQRRRILIINSQMSRQNRAKKNKQGKAESLLYEEYSDDGVKVYSYSMSNLDDVARFFQYYLNTHICHGTCEKLPTTTSPRPQEPLTE